MRKTEEILLRRKHLINESWIEGERPFHTYNSPESQPADEKALVVSILTQRKF